MPMAVKLLCSEACDPSVFRANLTSIRVKHDTSQRHSRYFTWRSQTSLISNLFGGMFVFYGGLFPCRYLGSLPGAVLSCVDKKVPKEAAGGKALRLILSGPRWCRYPSPRIKIRPSPRPPSRPLRARRFSVLYRFCGQSIPFNGKFRFNGKWFVLLRCLRVSGYLHVRRNCILSTFNFQLK